MISRELSKTRIQHLLSTYSVPGRLLSAEESNVNQEIKLCDRGKQTQIIEIGTSKNIQKRSV